jgi:hypothetical protein
MKDLSRGTILIDDVSDIAPRFAPTITTLLDVMSQQEQKQRRKQASQEASQSASSVSTIVGIKRPLGSPIIETFAKRTKQDSASLPQSEPTTPDQATRPADPNQSGDTIESKDEENTKMLLKTFLTDTLRALRLGFRELKWHRSDAIVEMVHTYNPSRMGL